MMKTKSPWPAFWLGSFMALAGGLLAPVHAACPQSLCDCLGETKHFTLAASDKLSIKQGFLSYYGYNYLFGTFVLGDVCGPTAFLSGPSQNPRTQVGSLVALAGPGTVAARFLTLDSQHLNIPGVVADLVATGGGAIAGDVQAGVVDTTGTHPRLASCQQAITDMQSASATLAALTPTQDLGRVVVRGEMRNIAVGPGVQVIAATSISLHSTGTYGLGNSGVLRISADPGTQAVILNTSRLTVGRDCALAFSGPSDTMIINVSGKGATVRIADTSYSEAILAPQRSVTVGIDTTPSNIYAQTIRVRGTDAEPSFTCTSTSTTTTVP
jgi:hypothetical protein